MAVSNADRSLPGESVPQAPARVARGILRRSSKAALATLEASGHPLATLVGVATAIDGTPLLLLSRLARHTRNLAADQRASLLVEGADTDPDPLARGRVTVVGEAQRTEAAATRRRFARPLGTAKHERTRPRAATVPRPRK